MELKLTDLEIEEFLIRLYFDTVHGFEKAAAKRAYRDFSRTLRDLSKIESEKQQIKNEVEDILLEQIKIVLTSDFKNQWEFDFWHQKTCEKMKSHSKMLKLTFGQTQKWVNMTLKYMYTLKEKRVSGINRNVKFFHVPIDNIIQEKFREDKKMWGLRDPWSRIDDYSIYLDYQKQIRDNYKGEIPFEVEFRLFNQIESPVIFK
jgi:hypothetical protein